MNRFDRFLARHPSFQAFFYGMSGTMGIFPVGRYVESPEESLQAVNEQIRSATREVLGDSDHLGFHRIEHAIDEAERHQSEVDDDAKGAKAYGVMFNRYGHCEVHQFVPKDENEQRCRHCDGQRQNPIHWSV